MIKASLFVRPKDVFKFRVITKPFQYQCCPFPNKELIVKYIIGIIDRRDNKIKIMEMGVKEFVKIRVIYKKFGDPENYDLEFDGYHDYENCPCCTYDPDPCYDPAVFYWPSQPLSALEIQLKAEFVTEERKKEMSDWCEKVSKLATGMCFDRN